jgi:hypothetical protein
MSDQDDTAAGAAAAEEIDGKLRTQSGPRTVAPMWARPLLTEGEWSIYTALWSFGTWNGTEAWPKHQTLADRAWSERGSVINAIAKFVKLGLVVRTPRKRADNSQTSNEYVLVEVCPDALVSRLVELFAERQDEQAKKKAKRDADKRKYRKPVKGASAAETTPSEDDQQGGNDVGSPGSDPTDDGCPDWARDKEGSPGDDPRGSLDDDPRGSLPNGPVTYPGFDLSPSDQSPPTAVTTHAADAPASTDAEDPAELGEQPPTPSPVPAVGGKFSPEDQTQLTTAVDAAVAARKTRTGWPRPAVVAAVVEALDAGHSVAAAIAGLAEITKDPATDYPARLAPFLAAKAKRADASAPAEPYRHKPAPACVKGCDCWKHQAPAGEGPGLGEGTVDALAALRATLPAGKPVSRYGTARHDAAAIPSRRRLAEVAGDGSATLGEDQGRANPGTGASGEISTESEAAEAAA